jgi:hypothetical protein
MVMGAAMSRSQTTSPTESLKLPKQKYFCFPYVPIYYIITNKV